MPGASDSARYKALGNSVPVPCVEYIMAGIARAAEGADIVAYACFPAKSLLLLVMAIYRRDRYTCVTKQKGANPWKKM